MTSPARAAASRSAISRRPSQPRYSTRDQPGSALRLLLELGRAEAADQDEARPGVVQPGDGLDHLVHAACAADAADVDDVRAGRLATRGLGEFVRRHIIENLDRPLGRKVPRDRRCRRHEPVASTAGQRFEETKPAPLPAPVRSVFESVLRWSSCTS